MKLHYYTTRLFLIALLCRIFPSSKALQSQHISAGIILLSFMAPLSGCVNDSKKESSLSGKKNTEQIFSRTIDNGILNSNTKISCYAKPAEPAVEVKSIKTEKPLQAPSCYSRSKLDTNNNPNVVQPPTCYRKSR